MSQKTVVCISNAVAAQVIRSFYSFKRLKAVLYDVNFSHALDVAR